LREIFPVHSFKAAGILFTVLWALVAVLVSLFWMRDEYRLIEADNGDGTVTFRDGPDMATSTKTEFFLEAVKNTAIVVFFFPTLPYLLVMGVVLAGALVAKRRQPSKEGTSWEEEGRGSMAERFAKMKDRWAERERGQ